VVRSRMKKGDIWTDLVGGRNPKSVKRLVFDCGVCASEFNGQKRHGFTQFRSSSSTPFIIVLQI